MPNLLSESKTGVTLHRMDAGIPTGPIIPQTELGIESCETAESLYEKLIFSVAVHWAGDHHKTGSIIEEAEYSSLVQCVDALERIASAANDGFGRVCAFRDPGDGYRAFVIIMIFGGRMQIICCVSPIRHQGIKAARAAGLEYFGFNGANGPNRAQDKHVFGAKAVPYLDCFLRGLASA